MRVLWKKKEEWGRISNAVFGGYRFRVRPDGSLEPEPSPSLADMLVKSGFFVYEGHEAESLEKAREAAKARLGPAKFLKEFEAPELTPGKLMAKGPFADIAERGARLVAELEAQAAEEAKQTLESYEEKMAKEAAAMQIPEPGSVTEGVSYDDSLVKVSPENVAVAETIKVAAELSEPTADDVDAILLAETSKKKSKK